MHEQMMELEAYLKVVKVDHSSQQRHVSPRVLDSQLVLRLDVGVVRQRRRIHETDEALQRESTFYDPFRMDRSEDFAAGGGDEREGSRNDQHASRGDRENHSSSPEELTKHPSLRTE